MQKRDRGYENYIKQKYKALKYFSPRKLLIQRVLFQIQDFK